MIASRRASGSLSRAEGLEARHTALTRKLAVLSAVLLPVGACAAPPRGAPPTQGTHEAAPAAPAPEARWRFSDAELYRSARLDLGEAGILHAGSHGRRVLVSARGTLEAAVPLPTSVDAMARSDRGTYLFVTSRGAVYESKEPLGRYERVHAEAPRGETVAHVAAGRHALLATRDGILERSIDAGRTWRDVPVHAAPPFALDRFELDESGRGLLVMKPQRVMATADDGASWRDITTTGDGAVSVRKGADGAVVLDGITRTMRLEGPPLRLVAGPPREAPSDTTSGGAEFKWTRAVAIDGGRAVSLLEIMPPATAPEPRVRKWSVSVGPLGAWPERRYEPLLDDCGSVLAAGFEERVVLACARDGAKPTVRLLTSHDFGRTWRIERTLRGYLDHVRRLAVGPGGFTYVPMHDCNDEAKRACSAYLRARDDVDFTAFDAARPFWAFVFEGKRVYALESAREESGRASIVQISVARRGDDAFVRLTELASADPYPTPGTLTIDASGDLRAIVGTSRGPALFRVRPDGTSRPPLHLPLGWKAFSAAGDRALAISVDEEGGEALVESADGGESWAPVSGLVSETHCSRDGCLAESAGAARLGWDRPLGTKGSVLARETPFTRPDLRFSSSGRSPPHSGDPPLHRLIARHLFACNSPGAPRAIRPDNDANKEGDPAAFEPISAVSAGLDLGVDTRWAVASSRRDGTVSAIASHGGARPVESVLLPPESKRAIFAVERMFDPFGLIAVRYSRGASESLVQIEVGWLDAATGKTHRRTLADVPHETLPWGRRNDSPNRVNAAATIVDDGLLFHPLGAGDRAWLLRADGTNVPFAWPALPKLETYREWVDVARASARTLVVRQDLDGGATTTMAWSGATGTTATWQWAQSPTLLRKRDDAALFDGKGWLFSLATAANDPPREPLRVKGDPAVHACDARGLRGFRLHVPLGWNDVVPHVTVGGASMGVRAVVLRVGKAGETCTSGILASNGDRFIAIAPHDPTHAWIWGGGGLVMEVRPIACEPQR